MSKPFLSKSKYIAGIQCPKLLWYHYNAKDEMPAPDAATEAKFDQGHEVGELAKKLFPGGIGVEWNMDFKDVLQQSQELLKERKPLFEAGFMHNPTYARIDVLDPVEHGKWNIIEVKMGARVKDPNYDDVAFQRYCCEGTGLPIRRCYLMHINMDYVRQGGIDPEQLFVKEDITEALDQYSEDITGRVREMLATIAARQCPECDIGPHCDNPYECVLKERCWAKVWKDKNHVFTLPNARGREWKLYGQGILRNEQIPEDFYLTNQQRIQIESERTGRPHVDKDAVSDFIDQLVYPVYFIDFETFGFTLPIPILDNTHPYNQIPFQFSVHVLESPDVTPAHHSWLWDGDGDPRPEFLKQLRRVLGSKGSVVVYNKVFESTRLRECAKVLHDYAEWVDDILERIVDLYALFRHFSVYYPSQHGRASMKAILPPLTGKSHDDLVISDGAQASEEFMRVMFGNVDDGEREKVRRDLEVYCALDTMGMVDIIRRSRDLVE